MAQSFGKGDSKRSSVGPSPSVYKLIVTNTHDLVFGVHQNCDPPAVTSPTATQSFLHMTKQSFYQRYITRRNYPVKGKIIGDGDRT